MFDVFVSYNQASSKEIVFKLVDKLKTEENLKVWADENEMDVGDNLYDEMANGIRTCKLFLAFITKEYCESSNCRKEIEFANTINKKCVYVMLEELDLENDDLKGVGLLLGCNYRFNAYKQANCKIEWSTEYCTKLVNIIHAKLNDLPRPIDE